MVSGPGNPALVGQDEKDSIMKRTRIWAVAGALMLVGTMAMAGDKTQSRKKAKAGSGDNCTIGSAITVASDMVAGTKTQSRKKGKAGSGENCTAE